MGKIQGDLNPCSLILVWRISIKTKKWEDCSWILIPVDDEDSPSQFAVLHLHQPLLHLLEGQTVQVAGVSIAFLTAVGLAVFPFDLWQHYALLAMHWLRWLFLWLLCLLSLPLDLSIICGHYLWLQLSSTLLLVFQVRVVSFLDQVVKDTLLFLLALPIGQQHR